MSLTLRTIHVTRYVTPLREGGSLPALAEGDDDFLYVLKFRGAGQGVRALIAELVGGEVARLLGLRVPELVFAEVDPAFGRTEPDEEIQDLLKASAGLNMGLHYLSGSLTYDPAVNPVGEEEASRIVWLDALLMNVDRTARNTNMLMWQKELWLIDHGAALYFHHAGADFSGQASRPFTPVKDHVLLPQAARLAEADAEGRALLTPDRISAVTGLLPAEWLQVAFPEEDPETMRAAYTAFLNERIATSSHFVNEALHARNAAL
ncbi:HipA family kinase [Flaviaesturariibacter amylovorans]|uniref:HipA-like kinase domain-containing protein n=1 Tax=Flaviaesturariibacter amylovorans TaxID=1084520 RepID=A0ABP8GQJ1_9BACT